MSLTLFGTKTLSVLDWDKILRCNNKLAQTLHSTTTAHVPVRPGIGSEDGMTRRPVVFYGRKERRVIQGYTDLLARRRR
jgi:hypothetical protein